MFDSVLNMPLSIYKQIHIWDSVNTKIVNGWKSFSVKSVEIRSFFWSIFSCIQSEYRKIQTRKNSVFWHFSRSAIFARKLHYRYTTGYYSFKRQPHKMVKYTQKIRLLQPKNCLSVFDHFVGLALKGVNKPLCKDICFAFRNYWNWFSFFLLLF